MTRTGAFVLLWMAAFLVPALGVLGAGLMSHRELWREAEARMDRTVGLLHQHALRAFDTQEAILTAAARATDGRSWDQVRQDEGLHRLLAELSAAGAPLVRGVLVVDQAGHTAAASFQFPADPVDLTDRDYIQAIRAGADRAVGEVVVSRPLGWRVFALARAAPARSGETAVSGALVSSFNPDPFSEFYASIVESPDDLIAIMRLDGAILAAYPPMPELASPQAGRAELRRRLNATLAQPRGTPLVPEPSVFNAKVSRLFVGRQIGDWPVAVVYGLDVAALRSAWEQRMLAPTISGLAAAVLLLALTWFAARGAKAQQVATERRAAAEAQLASAGRAATIGLLTAGLAHDVKNLVQAVTSGARLMASRADRPDEVRRCAGLLADAAERGRRLVEGILAFAGNGTEAAGPLPPLAVSPVLTELVELLNRTLGQGWKVVASIPHDLAPVHGNRAEFEAAVVNLAANARDAMPEGGRVGIAAWEQTLALPDAGGLAPGRYLVVAVSDHGMGMDAATLARVGEPFFTTKAAGRGTGLGLATVRAFCLRAGGALRLDSETSRGTTAAMWLRIQAP